MTGLRVTPIECHGITCQPYQWCSQIDIECKNCSLICDINSDLFASVDCHRDCQDYLHDFRYARLDGKNISDVSAELMTRVFTLTVAVTVLGSLFAIQLAFLVYHVVSAYRQRSRLQQKRLMNAGGALEQKVPPKAESSRFLRMIGLGDRSATDDLPMHHIATVQRNSFRSSQFGRSARPNSLFLGMNRSGPSEDSCPPDETETVYENLAFSPSTPTPYSMANRPLPHPATSVRKSPVRVSQHSAPVSNQSLASTPSTSPVSQTSIPIAQSQSNRLEREMPRLTTGESYCYPSQLSVTSLSVRQAALQNTTSTPQINSHAHI